MQYEVIVCQAPVTTAMQTAGTREKHLGISK